jgi:hypothetical protein
MEETRIGAQVVLRRDALVEIARQVAGAPSRWELLEAGTLGKLLGFRDRPGEDPRAVVEVRDRKDRVVVFVRETSLQPRDHL